MASTVDLILDALPERKSKDEILVILLIGFKSNNDINNETFMTKKALIEKEERKWKEIEASLISSISNFGNREASTMAAIVRAVGRDFVLDTLLQGKEFQALHVVFVLLSYLVEHFRWHIITLTIDADLGEATCYLDVYFDCYQTGLPLRVASCIRELGTDVWVGIRPPIDVDYFGRSDSEGAESKVHIMDVFLWGRYLTEDEIVALPVGVDLYNVDDVDWDGQYSSGRK
ncbi:hypothetical protein H5410_062028 [Solanum commersonii]|uniref:Uncharacterized protein n=1 Tax=Solanum commersonii TaxID=4109 RepID=A0A9J5WBD9_SOLCO|nr:hypothetical protein H5410_062028 [Solanum commersonii]